MKDFNKILYDILLKLDLSKNNKKEFLLNSNLIINYFNTLKTEENTKLTKINEYFTNFFNFCFELPLNNMIEEAHKFEY